ncbi:hypothetical protein FN846DRAFT_889324 [Sphaerosporella brunnea]|uniref:Uncharacterized protein n=1 Tax=Sphaerosporella brunnea TaxID=1250544 RepID=A0A5J5F0E4_9PEZI|nr:hypothetical protein FN846DRAFT_889324 [Sphaerosporella brunnea]
MSAMTSTSEHPIPTLNIISSHKISSKTQRIVSHLADASSDASDGVISVSANAQVITKAISIIEISKRLLSERGLAWYQYTSLSSAEEEVAAAVKPRGNKTNKRKAAELEKDEDEDLFVPLKEKKMRKVPVVTIYLARKRLPEFKALFGEQTGGGKHAAALLPAAEP